jgi:hypothetical protein
VGKDFFLSCLDCCEDIMEEIALIVVDDIESNIVTQQKIQLLHSCLEKVQLRTTETLLTSTAKEVTLSKNDSRKDSSLQTFSNTLFQLGDRIEVRVEEGQYHNGTIVKVNSMKKEYAVEYEDIDEQGNPIIKFEIIDFESAKEKLRASANEEVQSTSNVPETTEETGSSSENDHASAKFTLIELLNQFDRISKIISLIYLRSQTASNIVEVDSNHLTKPNCLFPNHVVHLLPDLNDFSCQICKNCIKCNDSSDWKIPKYRWKCITCNLTYCLSCTGNSRSNRKTLCLVSAVDCPIFADENCTAGQEIGSLPFGSIIDVINSASGISYPLVNQAGYVNQELAHGSHWKEVIPEEVVKNEDSATPNNPLDVKQFSCGYLASIIRCYVKMDLITKSLYLSESKGTLSLEEISLKNEEHLRLKLTMLQNALSMLQQVSTYKSYHYEISFKQFLIYPYCYY